jgi:hypothetical protein
MHLRLIDWSYPLDPELARILAPYRENGPPGLEDLPGLVRDIDGWGSRADLLGRWNRASILANFPRYLRACGYSVCWQLNLFPESGGVLHDELTWYVWRAAQDMDGAQFGGTTHADVGLQRYYMHGTGGPVRRMLLWWYRHRVPGIPQVPLAAIALLAALVSLLRRDWGLLLVWGGSLAFFAAHVSMLIPVGRYTMPMWVVWYVALSAALKGFRPLGERTAPECNPEESQAPAPADSREPLVVEPQNLPGAAETGHMSMTPS